VLGHGALERPKTEQMAPVVDDRPTVDIDAELDRIAAEEERSTPYPDPAVYEPLRVSIDELSRDRVTKGVCPDAESRSPPRRLDRLQGTDGGRPRRSAGPVLSWLPMGADIRFAAPPEAQTAEILSAATHLMREVNAGDRTLVVACEPDSDEPRGRTWFELLSDGEWMDSDALIRALVRALGDVTCWICYDTVEFERLTRWRRAGQAIEIVTLLDAEIDGPDVISDALDALAPGESERHWDAMSSPSYSELVDGQFVTTTRARANQLSYAFDWSDLANVTEL